MSPVYTNFSFIVLTYFSFYRHHLEWRTVTQFVHIVLHIFLFPAHSELIIIHIVFFNFQEI